MEFNWDDSFKTGDDTIDAQHRMIFDAANMFVDAIHQSKETAILEQAFDLLMKYTQTHFADEEAFYVKTGSTLLDEQTEQHKSLLDELNKIWAEKEAGSQFAGQALSVWMERRLIPHIINNDTAAQKARG
ncbi:hemerythrin family protein [Magnetovibrio sp. PR-2]|uniref:bacteriohemerythrin n=1 Tax=Magnetovibrio sp. PR-2 TaxID=3120356 RepID=UPI002FCDF25D